MPARHTVMSCVEAGGDASVPSRLLSPQGELLRWFALPVDFTEHADESAGAQLPLRRSLVSVAARHDGAALSDVDVAMVVAPKTCP
jgi:hypothetical protein